MVVVNILPIVTRAIGKIGHHFYPMRCESVYYSGVGVGSFVAVCLWTFMKLTSTETSWNFELRPEKSHLVKPVFCSWLSSICERSFIDEGNFLRNILIVLGSAETDINRHNNMRTQMKAKFYETSEIVCYPNSGVHATTIIFNVYLIINFTVKLPRIIK